MPRRLERRDLLDEVENLGGMTGADTALYVDLAGRDPDEGATTIPYNKGAAFFRLLEQTFGRERFDGYLQSYFDRFAFQPITTARFVTDMRERLVSGDAVREAAAAMGDRFRDYELLLFDDGSTDRTGAIMDELAAADPAHIRVTHNPAPRNLGGVYKQGIAPRVIISSGYVFTLREAESMKAIAEANGVPAEAILLEEQAADTYENVAFTNRILEEHGLRRIALVSSPYHMRRAVLTWRKVAPRVQVVATPPESSQFYAHRRGASVEQIRSLLQEYVAGVNWFLNPNTKVQWNYVCTERDSALDGGDDGLIHGFGMRLAHDF